MAEKVKSALLITYYWPPAGGAGVHRWLRFSKYFAENNWDLTVFCPKDAAWPILDPELNKSVSENLTILRTPIFEPHKYLPNRGGFNSGAGLGTQKKIGIFKMLIIWLRGNLFIPDSRKFWINPSVRYLEKYLKAHPEISTIISSGPPHSAHLIARKLKRKMNVKWVADFRDPWTEIDFYKDLLPGKMADKKHKRLEKAVLVEADKIVTVSKDCALGLSVIGSRPVDIITNGYVFPDFNPKSVLLDKKFSIAHFGSMSFPRNPEVVWKSLAFLLSEIPELETYLEIKLVGAVDHKVKESISHHGLTRFLTEIPQIAHSESIKMQSTTQILLLVANHTSNVKGILTGKFFEYLGAKRPILAVGQSGSDLEKEVKSTRSGIFVDYSDVELASTFIRDSFTLFLNKDLWSNSENTDRFSSRVLARKYIDLLSSI